ncbi:MAG: hypothetical protein V1494_02585 [Candidatus Diapherotrites archaeon]
MSLVILFFAASASADISLVKPIDLKLKDAQQVLLGAAQPGQTVEIIVTNQRGYADTIWSRAALVSLPTDWKGVDAVKKEKTLVLALTIPKNASQGTYSFTVAVSNPEEGFGSESFNAKLEVRNSLIKAGISTLAEDVSIGDNAKFGLIISNESIAAHRVLVDSTLSNKLFAPFEAVIPAGQTIEEELVVTPAYSGEKSFSFNIYSRENDSLLASFNARLKARPSLKGEFASALNGYPFFSPGLLPFQLLNSFLSYFMQ